MNNKKILIFDIETKNTFADVQSDNPADLDISVISLYDSENDKIFSFLENDFEKMWPFFEKADLLVSYNGNHFDIPLLQKYAPFDLKKIEHFDIFEEVKKTLGRKISLDNIAKATLKIGKSADGLQAVAWWNSGEIDKIIKYCEQDVKVTKDIYFYLIKEKKLYYENRAGEVEEIAFNLNKNEKQEEEPQNLSLF